MHTFNGPVLVAPSLIPRLATFRAPKTKRTTQEVVALEKRNSITNAAASLRRVLLEKGLLRASIEEEAWTVLSDSSHASLAASFTAFCLTAGALSNGTSIPSGDAVVPCGDDDGSSYKDAVSVLVDGSASVPDKPQNDPIATPTAFASPERPKEVGASTRLPRSEWVDAVQRIQEEYDTINPDNLSVELTSPPLPQIVLSTRLKRIERHGTDSVPVYLAKLAYLSMHGHHDIVDKALSHLREKVETAEGKLMEQEAERRAQFDKMYGHYRGAEEIMTPACIHGRSCGVCAWHGASAF